MRNRFLPIRKIEKDFLPFEDESLYLRLDRCGFLYPFLPRVSWAYLQCMVA